MGHTLTKYFVWSQTGSTCSIPRELEESVGEAESPQGSFLIFLLAGFLVSWRLTPAAISRFNRSIEPLYDRRGGAARGRAPRVKELIKSLYSPSRFCLYAALCPAFPIWATFLVGYLRCYKVRAQAALAKLQ